MFVNCQHIFERQRLKVEPVTGVVVGRDRLRIAVHHDGLVAIFAQRERRVAAAVIKFNSLPDAVWPAAQDHDFFLWRRRGLIFFLVGRIKIGCEALEFGGAVSTRL